MPSRPSEAPSRKENRHKPTRTHPVNLRQHGHAHRLHAASGTTDVLLSIPSESLTHVTSFLDPPDLLALARTCKRLNAHVADDNTWRRAYVYQYLGITPESDLRDDVGDKTIMLRREESSWKKEFILRYNLRRYVVFLIEEKDLPFRASLCGCYDTSPVASSLQRVRLEAMWSVAYAVVVRNDRPCRASVSSSKEMWCLIVRRYWHHLICGLQVCKRY